MYFKDCCIPNLQVLAKPEPRESIRSDGSKVLYHSVAVLQGQSAGMVDVVKEVYEKVEVSKFYDMYFSFNSDYEKLWLQIKAAIPSKQ